MTRLDKEHKIMLPGFTDFVIFMKPG